jgi:diamine N-acetyltransferase
MRFYPMMNTAGDSMSITLKEINKDNFEECIRLRVREDQPFVATNVYSVAESKVAPENIPLAVFTGDNMVGFVMYELDYVERKLYIGRLMIDQRYQHMGYGRQTLEALKQIALSDPGIEKLELSTNPKNTYGIRVYETFGFKDTGILDDGEEVFVLDLGKVIE